MVLLAALALAWLPGRPASAQSEIEAEVEACLNSSALSGMRAAEAHVVVAKTHFPPAPVIGGQSYVPVTDGLYAIAPDQLRYHDRLVNGEPLFSLFGTVLGAPGSLYMMVSTENEEGGCGFLRFNLRDRWMTTYRNGEFWEVIDRASVMVAFEIDEIDPHRHEGWSVLVRGTLGHLDASEAALREHFDPGSWLAGRDSWLVVEPFAITGRRLIASEQGWAFDERGYL